ncbi:MAG: hypothetical protein ACRETQ_10415 [Gammaproteobacteria bacterium]
MNALSDAPVAEPGAVVGAVLAAGAGAAEAGFGVVDAAGAALLGALLQAATPSTMATAESAIKYFFISNDYRITVSFNESWPQAPWCCCLQRHACQPRVPPWCSARGPPEPLPLYWQLAQSGSEPCCKRRGRWPEPQQKER